MWWPWKWPLVWFWPWKGPLVWLWYFSGLWCIELILCFNKCLLQLFYFIEHVACRWKCILHPAKVVSAWNSVWKSLTSAEPVEVDFHWFNTFFYKNNCFAHPVHLHFSFHKSSDYNAWLLAFFSVVHGSLLACLLAFLLVEEYGIEWLCALVYIDCWYDVTMIWRHHEKTS